ncbi:MAG TPA: RNA repair transcriptional activator RtcR [Phycisphaerales bacterium]|nr:RNA repair transcriptional activator RtcR [Phycisphaerales bacterium]
MSKPLVVIGQIGTTLDVGKGPARWERWRPTISVCQQEDLVVGRFELLHPPKVTDLLKQVIADIRAVSPETQVVTHALDFDDPWDFESVYSRLDDFARAYPFKPEEEEYLVHITTGTHVMQICLFLLTESRRLPGRLLQSGPRFRPADPAGQVRIIDLDLSKYDALSRRFEREHAGHIAGLKSGIQTRNQSFNRLMKELEEVAVHTAEPILITGPTGAGKSLLARRIYELKKHIHQVAGTLVEVNCATLRGDSAMSALFGHRRGAFTGAAGDRAGLLKAADGGVLFLDEIGELGLDEQAMLLRALEEKRFLPLGADDESQSNFQLIAGTNRDLGRGVAEGTFREDLLARINVWTFALPALRERPEDIEPNIDHELGSFAARSGRIVRFSAEARRAYVEFATSRRAAWSGNFRDLAASMTRLCALSQSGGRITGEIVSREIARLETLWNPRPQRAPAHEDRRGDESVLAHVMNPREIEELDRFDRVQLAEVIRVCMVSRSLSEAGRELFAASREKRTSVNDADRLRKYLARFGLTWAHVHRE